MPFIRTFDGFLSNTQIEQMQRFVKKCKYIYGVTDNKDTPPTGLLSYDELPEFFMDIIRNKIILPFGFEQHEVRQSMVNMFLPREEPFFHRDIPNGITIVYYCNTDYKLEEHGETQFIVVDEFKNEYIKGVLPLPGRFVVFSGDLQHRATSFKTEPRFTIALQLEP